MEYDIFLYFCSHIVEMFNTYHQMNFLRSFFLLLFTFLMVASCSNDFELTEKGGDIPIVYGVLSSLDSASYIRVERAFIDENTSALVLSKDPDQLYFKDIEVELISLKNTNDVFKLVRVDGNKEGYKRDQGAFADAPNYLYKLPRSVHTPVAGNEYRLVVRRGEEILTEAKTKILKAYTDVDLEPKSETNIDFKNNGFTTFNWFPTEGAVIHDLSMVFNYLEVKNGVSTRKSLVWPIGRNLTQDNTLSIGQGSGLSLGVKGSQFYSYLKANIPVDPQVKRLIDRSSIVLTSGGAEIKEYLFVGQANLGITSSGEIPTYSNLSKGARGIFSSTTKKTNVNVGFSIPTIDSLRTGIFTKDLGFQ
jgi:hypothetical protein